MNFSTVVGHDDLKTALLLAAIDPRIGGVLLRGEKGSGKTTIARALADLLPGAAPFVELPLGASEDRVLGSIDMAAALADGTEQVRSGLLAAADGGVLFVDEINLLADHLVDTLLDVAVSGQHRLERDGVSVVQPARFVLIGTMNPEEGELRPQLLDRFGLCVEVAAPTDPLVRADIVRRRLAVDGGSVDDAEDHALSERLAAARPAPLTDEVIEFASRLAVEVGAEGLRADLVLCRAAAALAGWNERDATTRSDVEQVAPMVLGHRRRRQPFDPPAMPPGELDEAIERATDPEPSESPASASGDEDLQAPRGVGASRPVVMGVERQVGRPPVARTKATRGRVVRDRPHDPASPNPVGVIATARALAQRRALEPNATVSAGDLRDVEHHAPQRSLVIVCLDTSGSMGADERIELATGTVLGVLTDAYQRRDRVAVVTFGGDGARTVLSPTTSVEVARSRLAALTTGGPTPLPAGLSHAFDLAVRAREPGEPVTLILVTDGRVTGGEAAFADALDVCDRIRKSGIDSVVIDTETRTPRLGLARRLADRLGAVMDTNPLYQQPNKE